MTRDLAISRSRLVVDEVDLELKVIGTAFTFDDPGFEGFDSR
jgi:hypothetical protein